MNTPEWEALRAFRQQVYTLFGCRRDALFETFDAVLSAPILETPAHLSLAPSCQRGWGSLYDARSARDHGPSSCSSSVSTCVRLARGAVADVRLPWQAPLSSERRTPARVRRAFSHVLTQLGSPVCVPKPCGRSPSRPKASARRLLHVSLRSN
jgi:hypothetical protein